MAWAAETVTLSMHSGTHVDAPYHYGPESSGSPARTIDDVPLRWCFGDGVVVDMTHKGRGEGITADDLQAELGRIGYRLKPYDIVLVRTDAWRSFKQPGYELRQPGLRRSATEWLVDRGVRLIGIDAWTLDRPFDVMAAEAHAGNRDQLWETHFLGKEKEYCQIERLCRLDEIPVPVGFRVVAFPVSIARASAGWSRVVAILEHEAPACKGRRAAIEPLLEVPRPGGGPPPAGLPPTVCEDSAPSEHRSLRAPRRGGTSCFTHPS
jgi:kynurenine formamidase